jgi:sugar phosphate permease
MELIMNNGRQKMETLTGDNIQLKGWGKRHTVFLAVFLTNFIVWLDEAIFGTLTPYWGEEFGLSSTQIASVSSAYLLGYFPMLFIAGILADRIGAKKLLITCLIGCTVLSASTILVEGFSQLWWRNFTFGIFFGFLWAPCNQLLTIWFPARERVRYTALWFSASMVAFGLAGPIGLTIAGSFRWQNSFLIVTFLGLPILLFFALVTKDRPGDKKGISKEELDYINSETGQESSKPEKLNWSHIKELAQNPSVYFMAIAAGLATTPNWLATTWGSYGLLNGFEVSPAASGTIITLMYAIPFVLCFTNSWVVNKLFKGHTRVSLALGPFIGGVCFVLVSFFTPNYVVYALLVFGAAVSNVYFWGTLSAYWTGIARTEVAGTLNGIGSAMQVAFGYVLVSMSGGWVNSSVAGVGALSKVWLIGGILFFITIIFIFLSKEVVIGKKASRIEQQKIDINTVKV